MSIKEQILLHVSANEDEIDELLDNWHPGDIDYASMLEAFPFEISLPNACAKDCPVV